MLSVRDLHVSVAGRTLLDGVTFDVRPGEVVGVLGPNGSGKTTLLEAICGLRAMRGGTVSVDGVPLRSFPDRAARIAYMPDDSVLPEEASLGVALGLSPNDAIVQRFALGSLLDARATEVSRGESKRAQIGATLKVGRPVALLDEPFGAFDPLQLRSLLPTFRDATRSVATVVTVHQMRTAEWVADRLLLLSGGRVVGFGTLDELRQRVGAPSASLDDVFLKLLDSEATERDAS